MSDKYEITPEARAVFDRLVKAGWLENVRDNPDRPSKGLLWYVDENEPANNGYNRFLAFYKLYQEFCKAGPVAPNELTAFESFAQTVVADDRGIIDDGSAD
jgi:hypothetical protein